MWNFEWGEVFNLCMHNKNRKKKKKLASLACVDH